MLYTPKFALGNIFVTPGSGSGNLQPTGASGTELEVIQDFSVEFEGKGVELRGQYLYAVDARVTDVSGKGKFKVGGWSLDQVNNLFYASTISTGATNAQPYPDEAHTIPASAPYTVTIDNPTGFVNPLTVLQPTGDSLTAYEEVSSVTAANQYSVGAGGVFTFDSANAGANVLISYVANGTNATLTINNNLQGQSPVIGITGFNAADGNGWNFPFCRVTGIKPLDLTMNKFAMLEVDFQVYCPLGQVVGTIIQANY